MSIFKKIIARELPSEIIYENDKAIVIKDINPQAPIHYLIIPKEPFVNITDIPDQKMDIMGELCRIAKYLATRSIPAKSYRLIVNNGKTAGQIVPHVHVHFMSWD
jgi:histidine triad (HIT) family protein